MRTTSGIAAALAVAASMATGASLPAGAETKFLFNHFPPPKFITATGIIRPWVEALNDALEPEDVTFRIPAKNLAAPPRQLDIVSQGIADGAFITSPSPRSATRSRPRAASACAISAPSSRSSPSPPSAPA